MFIYGTNKSEIKKVLCSTGQSYLNMKHLVQDEIVKYVFIPCLSTQTADFSVNAAGNSSSFIIYMY